jgi:hypothetical protein
MGQWIQASGSVIDSVKNKKLSNVTIYLYGAHASFYGVYYDLGPFDSTVSDINGNFSIKYKAEGTSVDYALAVGSAVYGGYSGQSNFVVDAYHPLYPFNYSRQLNNVTLSARELNYARVNLKVQLNPYDTLYLDVWTPYGELFRRNQIVGRSIDTSILTRYLPNAINYFQYDILSRQLLDSGWFIRRLFDTLTPKLNDTIIISKTLKTTYEIPLEPY